MRWLSHSHWLEGSYTKESELSLEHVTNAKRKHSEKMREITLTTVYALKVKAKRKCLKAFVALRKQWMQLH